MADSLRPTAPEYINVNCDSKPDTSKFNKDLAFNKNDVNQNKDFEKSSSSDKFKNSPLLSDKKHLLSPRSSPLPRRVSPAHLEQKVINSPIPLQEQYISPSPIKEDKIINSPLSGRSSVSNSQEFRLVNPTSRSASVSSQLESPVHTSQDFIAQRNRSYSDNDSLGDAEILELLSDDAADGNNTATQDDDVFADHTIEQTSNTTQSEALDHSIETSSNSVEQNTIIGSLNGDVGLSDSIMTENDLRDETIAELQLIEAEGLTDEKYDKEEHSSIEIIQNRSSTQFDSEEALSGLLEIAEMADDFGLSDENLDNMSQAMSAWIEESIDNLKGMLKRTIQRPSKRKIKTAPNNTRITKLQSPTKVTPQKPAIHTPNHQSRLQIPKAVKTPSSAPVIKTCPDSQYSDYSDSPLARFSQPSQFETRLAAKLTIESLKDQNETGTSPIPPLEGRSRKGLQPISQSASGDFAGSSHTSPSGEYDTSGSNYNSEPPSRSYTPSYASYTPSDASENSDTDSSPGSPSLMKPGGAGKGGGGGLRPGVRGRATGIRRVRPSYSGEHLGGLVESSSCESFVSNKSEQDQEPNPRTITGLRKPRGAGRGRGLARPRINTATTSRPAQPPRTQASPQPPRTQTSPQLPRKQASPQPPRTQASPQPPRTQASPQPLRKQPSPQPPKSSKSGGSSGLHKPSGLQKPAVRGAGIPKPSGIARGSGKPRGSGLTRPGLKKPPPSKTNSNWDEGCF